MEQIKCNDCEQKFNVLDSLRRHRSQKHGINAEQTYIDYVLGGIPPKCKCGCGEKPTYLGIKVGYRDYLRGHSQRVNNNWGHNKEVLNKSHETQKKMHSDGRLKMWNQGLTIEDPRVKDNIDKIMANPNRGKAISKKLSGIQKSEEHKEKLSVKAKERWLNPDEREKQSHRRMEYIIKNGFQTKSKLEDTFDNILKTNFGLIEDNDYYRQYYIREIKSLYDFKISGKKILIEVDGDFWHCNPNTKFLIPEYEAQKKNLIQDKIKDRWCIDNGYTLLRFWESDINNNPEEVIKVLRGYI